MKQKKGISLIVLIVTIIVIIILAAVIIIALTKNNPIESAKEAAFKEDVRAIQDKLSMYILDEYDKNPKKFKKENINFTGAELVTRFEMPEKYQSKIQVSEGNVIYTGKEENEKEWSKDLNIGVGIPVPANWKKYIAEVTDDGVPIPKGFTHVAGTTKDTGLVIEDSNHNQFVWVPVAENEYEKDFTFPSTYKASSSNTSDPEILSGLDETADVNKYGGFYIGRYEATVADETSNGKVTCKKGNTVWTDISQTDSVAQAESMYTGDESSVKSGLVTGKAWDRTCHFISDYKIKVGGVEETISLTDSRKYGNYGDAISPANTGTYTQYQKQAAGANDNWKTKNIYDLAGNVWEWTYEGYGSRRIYRGGSYDYGIAGNYYTVSFRDYDRVSESSSSMGFRIRLYIKTN